MDEMWLLLALLAAVIIFMAAPCPMASQYSAETCMFDEVPDPFPTLLTGFGRENIGPY